MAKFAQRWVESIYMDVVIEADSIEEARETFDRLGETQAYNEFLWCSVSECEGDLECIYVERCLDDECVSLDAWEVTRMLERG